MGWETNGKPSEPVGSEFVVYVNAFWVEGDIIGGVYNTEQEAVDAGIALIAEFEGINPMDSFAMKDIVGMNAAEVEDRIAEQDVVGFSQVAKRDILFT
jgi:hypothetical protein